MCEVLFMSVVLVMPFRCTGVQLFNRTYGTTCSLVCCCRLWVTWMSFKSEDDLLDTPYKLTNSCA